MKLRDYRKHTFGIISKWLSNPSPANEAVMLRTLIRWTRSRRGFDLKDYGYTGSFKDHIVYCCDRMNAGRAKSLLRLWRRV